MRSGKKERSQKSEYVLLGPLISLGCVARVSNRSILKQRNHVLAGLKNGWAKCAYLHMNILIICMKIRHKKLMMRTRLKAHTPVVFLRVLIGQIFHLRSLHCGVLLKSCQLSKAINVNSFLFKFDWNKAASEISILLKLQMKWNYPPFPSLPPQKKQKRACSLETKDSQPNNWMRVYCKFLFSKPIKTREDRRN